MKHIFLFLFLATCTSPAFAQKAKAGKYKKARVKTEIAKLPSSYNPIPETMPAMNMLVKPIICITKANAADYHISICGSDQIIYIVEGLPVRSTTGNGCPQPGYYWIHQSGTSAKYSGIPEDDNWHRQF